MRQRTRPGCTASCTFWKATSTMRATGTTARSARSRRTRSRSLKQRVEPSTPDNPLVQLGGKVTEGNHRFLSVRLPAEAAAEWQPRPELRRAARLFPHGNPRRANDLPPADVFFAHVRGVLLRRRA